MISLIIYIRRFGYLCNMTEVITREDGLKYDNWEMTLHEAVKYKSDLERIGCTVKIEESDSLLGGYDIFSNYDEINNE